MVQKFTAILTVMTTLTYETKGLNPVPLLCVLIRFMTVVRHQSTFISTVCLIHHLSLSYTQATPFSSALEGVHPPELPCALLVVHLSNDSTSSVNEQVCLVHTSRTHTITCKLC